MLKYGLGAYFHISIENNTEIHDTKMKLYSKCDTSNIQINHLLLQITYVFTVIQMVFIS